MISAKFYGGCLHLQTLAIRHDARVFFADAIQPKAAKELYLRLRKGVYVYEKTQMPKPWASVQELQGLA